ncbi:hypothetical protein ACQR1H_31890, partial [Bradyrhizobium sp. HKCCYLRH2015]|uniref:hypothetical protein n=1 Tax=Bradyrhizobium sp. HKCCYLRH2015 TaxID=3420742 RepID=UPI003EC14337
MSKRHPPFSREDGGLRLRLTRPIFYAAADLPGGKARVEHRSYVLVSLHVVMAGLDPRLSGSASAYCEAQLLWVF